MNLFKKKATPPQNNTADNEKGKFRQFAYILAWIAFLSTVGSAIFDSLKNQKPPDKDDYYK